MAEKQFFNVQIFELNRRNKLVQGRLHQLKTELEAQRKFDVLASKDDTVGVVAYSLIGDPDFDTWEEPRLIAAHGQVPDELAA